MGHLQALRAISHRNRQPEVMDQPGLDASDHALALRGLKRINSLSGSARIFWPTLRRLAREQPCSSLRVLDVASGGGDVTIALAQMARHENVQMKFSGCDLSETALEIARRAASVAEQSIDFFVHDVLTQSIPERFDVIISSLFLHHLDETDVAKVLRSMSRSAARAVMINDLVRSRLGYLLAVLATRVLSRSRVVHVDGPLSVAGAFTPHEVLRLCEQAGLQGATISRHWPQRFLLTWRRP